MKKKTQKNKMTLDNLAAIVQGEFLQVGKKFNVLENRFDNLEKKVDDGFSNINARLDMIDRDIKGFVRYEDFEDLMARVKYLERKLGIESGK